MPGIISHATTAKTVEAAMQAIRARIQQQGDKPYATVQRQLELLEQLSQFEFGRFILTNRGVNGYWSHYMIMHPRFGRKTGKNQEGNTFSALESFILNRAPTLLATQQRAEIFLRENQIQVKNHAILASIPCGMMAELLYLDFSAIQEIQLVGVDYDASVFVEAAKLAHAQGLATTVQWLKKDAWQLQMTDAFDLISSNGLTVYESDNQKIRELYQQFYAALKPGGKLVTSFLTYPPLQSEECEWDMAQVNLDDLLLQKIIFVDILDGKWQCYQSSAHVQAQLQSIGYSEIKMIYDTAKIFPTVVAYKPG